MNVWEGFRIDRDAFAAERDISQFILWRSREEEGSDRDRVFAAGQKGGIFG